ncbi:MAG TPA: GntR family transcriptional regulator [Planctomycetota bacterium]|nr:GntR family transcriptional regulator [Planctomycetota bacterium]
MTTPLDSYAGQTKVALDHVCAKLFAGKIAPGARVSERALARELKMSIIPVREALAHLIAFGVLVKIPHYGTFAQRLEPGAVARLADFRLMAYAYAIARAAADPEPGALAELKAAARQFEEKATQAVSQDWGAATPEAWDDMVSGMTLGMLAVFQQVLRVARMDVQVEMFRRADLLHVMLAREAWQVLSRRDMVEHLDEAYVKRPLGEFVAAIEAGDVERAQRLHFERARFAYHDMGRRILAARGEGPESPAHAHARLTDARFEFLCQ